MIKVFNVLDATVWRDYVVNDYAPDRFYIIEPQEDGGFKEHPYNLMPPSNAALTGEYSTLHDYLMTINPPGWLRRAAYVALWPKVGVFLRQAASLQHDPHPEIAMRYGAQSRHLRRVTAQFVRDIRNEQLAGCREVRNAAIDMVEQVVSSEGSAAAAVITQCVNAFNAALDGTCNAEYSVVRAAHCGHWCIDEEKTSHDDGSYEVCPRCAEDEYVICAETGYSRHRESLYYWDSDDEYHDEPEDYDDGDGESCEDLLGYSSTSFLHLTQDKPSAQKISSTWKFPLGVELEVEHGARNHAVPDTLDKLGRDYIVCKQDGSLSDDDGFEIVTAARLLPEHIKRFKEWKPLRGMTAWDAECCGMHVHIDSRAFTTASLMRMITFFDMDHNANWITNIAGRHPNTDSHAKNYAAKTTNTGVLARVYGAKKTGSAERRRMVNTCSLSRAESIRLNAHNGGDYNTRGFSTVEVRVFRASLNKARLLAQIEFTHAIVTFSRLTSNRALKHEDFTQWLLGCSDNKNMYQHLVLFLGHDRKGKSAAPAQKITADTVINSLRAKSVSSN